MKLSSKKILFEALLIATGSLIFLFSLLSDLLFRGSPGVGYEQIAGMTFSILIILIGLRYFLLPGQLRWDFLLFIIYLSGLLFVTLRPTGSADIHHIGYLGMNNYSKRDFVLNIAGLIPFGFLISPLIGHNIDRSKSIRLVVIAALFGFAASLVIETLQYLWIPGRYSSAFDLAGNTFGVIIGAACYVILRSRQFIAQII